MLAVGEGRDVGVTLAAADAPCIDASNLAAAMPRARTFPAVAHGKPGETVAVETPFLIAGDCGTGKADTHTAQEPHQAASRTTRRAIPRKTDINVHLSRTLS